MMIKPIKLGHFPTPIEPLTRLKSNKNLYIKRDDYSGIELSGNKVRNDAGHPCMHCRFR